MESNAEIIDQFHQERLRRQIIEDVLELQVQKGLSEGRLAQFDTLARLVRSVFAI
jgi:hypothetical protein